MRKLVVAALLAALVAACDDGGNCDCYKHKGDLFGDDLLDLFDWMPGGSDLLRQAERTVVRDAVGELEEYSAKTLQNARVPGPGQDIVYTSISTRYMDAGDLALFASRFGPGSGVTMYAGSQPKEPGEYIFVSVEHVAETPLFNAPLLSIATDRRFQYGAVFQMDGIMGNDWPGIAPFDCDLFLGTDSWYQVSRAPGENPQLTHQLINGTSITDTPTGACAIAYGNAILWMIPKSEFPERNLLPTFRATAFEAAADFGQTSGDFSIDTNPLRLDPLAAASIAMMARSTPQIEIEARIVATNLDFENDFGLTFDFLGSLEVDDTTPGETAVANDTAGNRLVRTMTLGGAKGMYNYVPFGSQPGSFFPLAFQLSMQPGNATAFARTPGDVGIPFVAPSRSLQPNDIGIDLAVPNVLLSDPTRGDLFGSYLDSIQYQTLLLALEQNANATVISAPRITTLNGQTAAIQSLNYLTPVNNLLPIVGNLFQQRDPSVQDAETGLQLQITPHLLPDGMIRMELRPAESAAIRTSQDVQADGETFGVLFPSIVTKDIQTQVLIESGETIVIGGFMQQGQMTIEQGVPWLNKIPVIDSLFASGKDYDESQNLIIIVTPYIVQAEDR
jgi:Flp pilus assembly secretin CpaC